MNKIPKVLHYCWFGGAPKSEKIQRCMDSWRRHLPEYDIIEWNESNCDIASSKFANKAYKAKKWAFVADYFRFKILYEHGGIYLDTDVLINKPLEDFLSYNAFFPMECYNSINATTVGAVPKCPVIKDIINEYINYEDNDEKSIIYYPVPEIITQLFTNRYGFKHTGYTQVLGNNIAVLSPNIMIADVGDGKNCCEHLYDVNVSWWDEDQIKQLGGKTWKYMVLMQYFHNLFGRPPCKFNIFNDDVPVLPGGTEQKKPEPADDVKELIKTVLNALNYIDGNPSADVSMIDDINDAAAAIAGQLGISPPLALKAGDTDLKHLRKWLESI